MKFQIKDLKKLLYSIQQNHIDEINITSDEFALIINTSYISNNIVTTQKNISNKKNSNHKNKINNDHLNNKQIANNISETYFTIVSPMVGTFYCSPAPNEPAFVDLYDIVQKKQTVCIIEAMKLMNEIESEVNGEIVEILVQDGDIIDCGQALMRVKPINK